MPVGQEHPDRSHNLDYDFDYDNDNDKDNEDGTRWTCLTC